MPACTNTPIANKLKSKLNTSNLQSKVRSVLRSSMHPYHENWVAIGRAVVHYALTACSFSTGIKCKHCSFLVLYHTHAHIPNHISQQHNHMAWCISTARNLFQLCICSMNRFGDRAVCAYAPRLWNELPDNIKASDSVQNFKTVKYIAISKGFYLTIL